MTHSLRGALCAVALALVACGGDRPKADLEKVPAARASCEDPTASLLNVSELMLPGRNCQSCHIPGGQAGAFRLTISGTVFRNLTVPCNSGGVSGVKVEILDMAGNVQVTMTSNSTGNFYTAQQVSLPFRARISQGSTTREMVTSSSIGSCAACHQKEPKYNAEGQIYLNRS